MAHLAVVRSYGLTCASFVTLPAQREETVSMATILSTTANYSAMYAPTGPLCLSFIRSRTNPNSATTVATRKARAIA